MSKIEDDKTYVISDLRFIHEYEKIKHLDIQVIKVTRPSIISNEEHLSELEYLNIPFDKEIVNNSTIENYISLFDNL